MPSGILASFPWVLPWWMRTRTAPKTHVLSVGVYDAPLQEVEPGFLTILNPAPAKIEPLHGQDSTGRRAALANWLADPKNPLPARVMVNRLWHYHFGRGIVATPSDFGSMGERPTHPQLLDWLASEFVRQRLEHEGDAPAAW